MPKNTQLVSFIRDEKLSMNTLINTKSQSTGEHSNKYEEPTFELTLLCIRIKHKIGRIYHMFITVV